MKRIFARLFFAAAAAFAAVPRDFQSSKRSWHLLFNFARTWVQFILQPPRRAASPARRHAL
jgi:hypothetical protein